jgi:hypothetical protein
VHYVSHARARVALATSRLLDLLLGTRLASDPVAAENYQLMNYGLGRATRMMQPYTRQL